MKKLSLCSFLLSLSLLAGLLAPPASAAAAQQPASKPEQLISYASDPTVSSGGSAILSGMRIEAGAAILVDADYGQVLYEQNAHAPMYPASITKIMTTLLTLEAVDRGELSLEQVVTASQNLHTGIGEGASTADIRAGEQMRVIDLLYSAMLPSANEACNILAEAVCGSIPVFVERMNQRAAELGMEDTHFSNTHGYHDNNHYTSAYDISLMCIEAMKHETFRTLAGARSYSLPATNEHEQRTVHSTNGLITNWRTPTEYLYQYATGIKTGSTDEAGYCLASSAVRNGRFLIAVVLNAENPTVDGQRRRLQFSESSRLLEWGFDNFTHQILLDDTRLDIAEVEVSLSSQANYVAVRPEGVLEATLPDDLIPSEFDFTTEIDVDEEGVIQAPVEEGQVLGSISVSYQGIVYGTLPLVANASVERSELLYRLDQVQRFFGQTWVKLLLAAVAVLAVILLLRRALFGGRRGKRGGRGGYAYSGRSSYTGRRRR